MHQRCLTVRKETNNRKDQDRAGPLSRGEAEGCQPGLVRHCLLNHLRLFTGWTGGAVGASRRVSIVRSSAIDTPDSRVTAWATANTTSGCGAGVIRGGVSESAPATGGWVVTLGAVVSKRMTVGTLGEGVEA